MCSASPNFFWQHSRLEIELLLYCVRTRPDPHIDDRIRTLLKKDVDWTYLIGTALAHRVAPLICHTFERLGPDSIPEELMAALRVHFEDNAARNHHLVQELITIVQDLARENIPVIPFKGPTLAKAVYGDIFLRSAGDLDFLISPDDVAKTCEVLALRGYHEPESLYPNPQLPPNLEAASRRVETEYQFVRDENSVMVEPHWALAPSTLAIDIDYDGFWRRASTLSLDGGEVSTLSVEDLLLVLCVHGSKHQWVELRWINDIAELIIQYPRMDWTACLTRARHQGCERMVLLGLALAVCVSGASLPQLVQARLDIDATACALAQLTCERLFVEGNATPDPFKINVYRLRMRERLRDRISYVWRTLVTPRDKHLAIVHLPTPLYFIYYPIKLVHDYLLLPAWLAARHLLPSPSNIPDAEVTLVKNGVRASWTTLAEHWDHWSHEAAQSAEHGNALLIEAVDISPGQAILDLASGVGEPALGIAGLLGEEGLIVATDFVPTMLSTTQRRAAAAGIEGLDCCAADMEALPFMNEIFDRVVCRFGIMFCPHPDLALEEAYRVLRPGGRAAFLVWGRLEENTIFKAVHKIVGKYLNEPSASARNTPFRFSETDELSLAMQRSGFTEVEIRDERFTRTVALESRFWLPLLEMTFGGKIDEITPDMRKLMNRSLEAEFADCLQEDGYRIATHMRIVVGTHR